MRRAVLRELSILEVVPLTAELVLAGVDRARRSQLSLWDGLIVEAALVGGCEVLLTEDLSADNGSRELVVDNPPRHDASREAPALATRQADEWVTLSEYRGRSAHYRSITSKSAGRGGVVPRLLRALRRSSS